MCARTRMPVDVPKASQDEAVKLDSAAPPNRNAALQNYEAVHATKLVAGFCSRSEKRQRRCALHPGNGDPVYRMQTLANFWGEHG